MFRIMFFGQRQVYTNNLQRCETQAGMEFRKL